MERGVLSKGPGHRVAEVTIKDASMDLVLKRISGTQDS